MENNLIECIGEEIKEYEIEEAIEKSGSYGRFQIIVTISTMLVVLFTACQSFILYYVADDPPWSCVAKNSSKFCLEHYGEAISQASELFSKRCKMRRDEWKFTKDKDFSIVSEFDLVCDKSYMAALTNSAYFIGWGVCGIFSGYLSDAYGRKIILFISLLVLSSVSLASTYITATWQLICLRMIIGASYGSSHVAAFIMVTEVVGARYRVLAGSFFFLPGAWSNLTLTLLAYYENHWRKIILYSSFPAFSLVIITFMLPETVRWLHAIGKTEKAEQLVIKIAKINKKKLEGFKLKSVVVQHEKKITYSYVDLLFRNVKVSLLVLCISYQWMSTAMIFYGFALEFADLGGSIYFNFTLSCIVDLPTPLTYNLCCRKFGRKSYVGFTVLICITLISLSVLSALPESLKHIDLIKVIIALFGKFFVTNSFLVLYVWSFELYPTVVRSQGQMLGQVAGRIGSASSPFIATTLSSIYRPLPFVLMAGISVLSLVFSLILPDTDKNKTRENFDDIFDTPTNVIINNEDMGDKARLLSTNSTE